MIASALTFVSVRVRLLTNATKVVKSAKTCYSVCAASWRAAHNVAELQLIVVDFIVSSEYVLSFEAADYDLYSKTRDIISEFTN